jgi:hypothetical protein
MESLAVLVIALLTFSHGHERLDRPSYNEVAVDSLNQTSSHSPEEKITHPTVVSAEDGTMATQQASANSTTEPTGCRLIDWVIDLRTTVLSSSRIVAPRSVNIGACTGQCSPRDYLKTKYNHRVRLAYITGTPLPTCSPGSSCNICSSCQPDIRSLKPVTILQRFGTGLHLRSLKNVVVTRCSCQV